VLLFGWRQSKRRILGAGRIKRPKVMQGKRRSSGSNLRPRPTKSIEPEELVKERRGDVEQDGGLHQFCGQPCMTAQSSKVTLTDQKFYRRQREGDVQTVSSCIDREQGDPSFSSSL
jgi:hypothetical protein